MKMVVSQYCFPYVGRQFQVLVCFPAAKHGLILGWEAEKALIWMRSMSESHWCNLDNLRMSEGPRLDDLVWNLLISNPGFESSIFKCISWLNVFVEWWSRISEWGGRSYQMAQFIILISSPPFFCLHLYRLWMDPRQSGAIWSLS